MAELGHYVGFVGQDGGAVALAAAAVQNFLPNGVHAVVIEATLIRRRNVSLRTTYDLVITRHSLEGAERKRRN